MTGRPPRRGQLTFPIERERFPDRNLHQGGRSFYFFDFDDNVMFLPTPIYVFEKGSRREVALDTGHFARVSHIIGQPGPFADFEVDVDDVTGSFRRFRDDPRCLDPRAQHFAVDLLQAIEGLDVTWKGPSWDFFEHAVHNARPLSIITARGHHPKVLEAGIALLYEHEHLSRAPNYLGIYPVSHPEMRRVLGGGSVAEMKRAAIKESVYEAMRQYGRNDGHRFGMSDDSPENVRLSLAAMAELKAEFPHNAFFVFDASQDPLVRIEVTAAGAQESVVSRGEQLRLFDDVD